MTTTSKKRKKKQFLYIAAAAAGEENNENKWKNDSGGHKIVTVNQNKNPSGSKKWYQDCDLDGFEILMESRPIIRFSLSYFFFSFFFWCDYSQMPFSSKMIMPLNMRSVWEFHFEWRSMRHNITFLMKNNCRTLVIHNKKLSV